MKKFFLSVFLFTLIVILVIAAVILYMIFRYREWEKEFEAGFNNEYLISQESIEGFSIEQKITDFTLSFEDTEFLELSVQDVGMLLFTTLKSNLGKDIKLEYIYIEPENGKWDIYAKGGVEDILIWFAIDINKDSMQTAQIYITSVHIGPFEIPKYFKLVELVNKGIGDTIVTLNENGFVGRYLENIELLNDSVVLKGSTY